MPRVLVSYAHSEAHSPAVLELADRLRQDGIDAWIDQYELAPPPGWRAWMEDQLRRADFVLVVASELYRGRAETSGPLEAGRGARFESTLILDDLYESGMWNVKYVPVVLLEQDREHVLGPLRSYQRYSLYRDGGYERLLRHLTGQPETPAPPLGPRRKLPPRRRRRYRDLGDDPMRSLPEPGDGSPEDEAPGPGSPEDDTGGYLGLSKGDTRGGFSTPTELPPLDDPAPAASSLEDLPPEDRPNPFDPWTPAVPPRFRGRASELRRLERALETGFGVSVVGDGRIGKSSLLRTFQGRLAESGRTVRYLDGQGGEGASVAAFVAKAVRKPVAEIPADADGAADALAAWVDGASGVGRPVILVDEFDHMPERFDPRFFERLRNLIGRLVLVVSSRTEVDLLYEQLGKTSPFDNRLTLVRVGLPKLEDADAVVRLGEELLDGNDPEELRRWAGRHFHYLQLYARHLLDARAHDEEDDALDRFLDESASRLRDLWRHLSSKEQRHLQALARGEDVRPPRTLIRRGVLEKDGRPFGEVLRQWLEDEM